MIALHISPGREPGTWWAMSLGEHASANVICPQCGRGAWLSAHSIDRDGNVNPALVCPHQGCTFHDHIKLEGWNR